MAELQTTIVVGDSCLLQPVVIEGGGPSLFPNSLLVADLVQTGVLLPPQLLLKGQTAPATGWKDWVKNMSNEAKFVQLWRQVGIEHAIMSSTIEIYPDCNVIAALSGFWCPVTSTFIFPWGEATFTLQDAHILGNLPIRGSPLATDLSPDQEELWLRLVVEKEKILELHATAKLAGKITNQIWLEWFSSLEGEDELKHLGFLAYWLSNYIFPSKPTGEVSSSVFKMAARLYHGERLALASAVTASIYNDLSTVTTLARNSLGRKRSLKVGTWAPLGLLQAWVWERFKRLRPRTQETIPFMSCVRATRWSARRTTISYSKAVEILLDGNSFQNNPYLDPLRNWKQPEWFIQESQMLVITCDTADWVYDFLAIISSASLEGLSSDGRSLSVSYRPHRVAMQFGYDQAVPDLSNTQVLARPTKPTGLQFQIIGLTKHGRRTKDYDRWWNEYMEWYTKILNDYAVLWKGEQVKVELKQRGKDTLVGLSCPSNGGSTPTNSNKESRTNACKKRKVDESNTNIKGREENRNRLADDTITNSCNHRSAEALEENILETAINQDPNIDGESSRAADSEILDGRLAKNNSTDVREVTTHDLKSQNDISLSQGISEKKKKKLLKELEEFEHDGLMEEWGPSSPESDECNQRSCDNEVDFNYDDPYGQEAIRMYPNFFRLLPQYPHYRGLLKGSITEEIRRDIYTYHWYKLVDLMKKALSSSQQADAVEVAKLLEEARHFEELGFNVKHLMTHLKEMYHRHMKAERATTSLNKPKEGIAKEKR